MKKYLFAFLFFVFVVPAFSSTFLQKKDGWGDTPKTTTFGEFKFLMQTQDKKTNQLIYEKQSKPVFALTKKLDGDKTVICYGSSHPDFHGHRAGVGCALKAIGASTCKKADFKKCSADNSIQPIVKN
jgi:hypothetical protein